MSADVIDTSLVFECDVCDERFASGSELAAHRRRSCPNPNPGEALHRCTVCNQAFGFAGAIEAHQVAVHKMKHAPAQAAALTEAPGPKRCRAAGCENPVPPRAGSHGGRAPTFCSEQCWEQFRRAAKRATPAPAAGHQCSSCDRSFDRLQGLRAHERAAHGDPVRCDVCSTTVRTTAALIAHVKAKHPRTARNGDLNPAIDDADEGQQNVTGDDLSTEPDDDATDAIAPECRALPEPWPWPALPVLEGVTCTAPVITTQAAVVNFRNGDVRVQVAVTGNVFALAPELRDALFALCDAVVAATS